MNLTCNFNSLIYAFRQRFLYQIHFPDFLKDTGILNLNRNARTPKNANKGARPCSSVMRRLRRKQWHSKQKEEMQVDPDAMEMQKLGI